MSITSDIRGYADTAIEQGKQVLDQAQAQLNDVTETVTTNANSYVGKFADTAKANVTGLRTQAEKSVNIDAVRSAVEPYLAQARGYSSAVSGRAGELLDTVKKDKRVAKLVDTAETISGAVTSQVQDYVVKPVVSFTGIGNKPAGPARKRTTSTAKKTAARKPATTRPASRTTSTATTKSPTKAATAKATSAKATAGNATTTKATATKPAPRKAAAKKTTA